MTTINFIDRIIASAFIVAFMYFVLSLVFVFTDMKLLSIKNEIIVLFIWTKFAIVFCMIDRLELNILDDIVKKYT